MLAVGLPAGKLLDMGYFKPAFFAGSLLYVFSCVIRSQVFQRATFNEHHCIQLFHALSRPS